MEKLFIQKLPEILKTASQNEFGVAAFAILCIAGISYLVFKKPIQKKYLYVYSITCVSIVAIIFFIFFRNTVSTESDTKPLHPISQISNAPQSPNQYNQNGDNIYIAPTEPVKLPRK